MPRDRIVELREVRAGDLQDHPRNWRRHSPSQIKAVSKALERNGWVAPIIAVEEDGVLRIVDGHLRAWLDPDELVPVLVTDLSASESDLALAVLDTTKAMAGVDHERVGELLKSIADEDVSALLQQAADSDKKARAKAAEEPETEESPSVVVVHGEGRATVEGAAIPMIDLTCPDCGHEWEQEKPELPETPETSE